MEQTSQWQWKSLFIRRPLEQITQAPARKVKHRPDPVFVSDLPSYPTFWWSLMNTSVLKIALSVCWRWYPTFTCFYCLCGYLRCPYYKSEKYLKEKEYFPSCSYSISFDNTDLLSSFNNKKVQLLQSLISFWETNVLVLFFYFISFQS